MTTSDSSRSKWDQRYERSLHNQAGRPQDDGWLERWRALLSGGGAALELGCGWGIDSAWLVRAGWRVTAGDFSFAALQLARDVLVEIEPPVGLLQLDLRYGLPFASGEFDVITASLCLHYFPWEQTVEILAGIRSLLKPGGVLLARFNSTRDAGYGAEGQPVAEEVQPAKAFWVNGIYKRYFDRESLDQLFGAGWERLNVEEMESVRYDYRKVLWEVVVRKSA